MRPKFFFPHRPHREPDRASSVHEYIDVALAATKQTHPSFPAAQHTGPTMVRKLKYHEATLLRKLDFINWKSDSNVREVKILRRYHVQDREDYHTYNKVIGMITKLTTQLKNLNPNDPVRIEATDQLVEKLHGLGLIQTKRLAACDKIAASTLCRRRLPVVLVRLKFAETMREAVTLVEQGHIRVGPHSITDPAYLVSRSMEDYVTWVDTSRIKRTIMRYNDRLDDYDLL